MRQCSLRHGPAVPQAEALVNGLLIRTGSCGSTRGAGAGTGAGAEPPSRLHAPPIEVAAGYLARGGCGVGGGGCGVSMQLSSLVPLLARPPGAPLQGNTTVSILGRELSSVRMCQFLVPGLPPDGGLAVAARHDAGGFRCAVPPLANRTLFGDYDRGAASQRVTLRLSEDGQLWQEAAGVEFVYFRPPLLTGADPLRGPITGATLIVRGLGLHAVVADATAARCLLGGVLTAVRDISPAGDALSCIVPPIPPGAPLDAT